MQANEIDKALLASASSHDFPFRVPNVPYVRYKKGEVLMERNAASFRPAAQRQSALSEQWGATDLHKRKVPDSMPAGALSASVHPFAQRSFKPESSQYSATQIGLHPQEGKRLRQLRAAGKAAYLKAAKEQDSAFRICIKTTRKLGNDPSLTYPHTFQKLLDPARRPQGKEPTPAAWHTQRPAGTRSKLLDADHQQYRTKTLDFADSRGEFTCTYRARQKDHLAHGKEPMHMGDTPDDADVMSLYGFRHVGPTTAGSYKRVLEADAKARASLGKNVFDR